MGFQDTTVKEATALAIGKKGRLTVTDTNVHYGLYFALTFLEDTVFDTAGLTDNLNQTANGLVFTSGGTTELLVGQFILGATSGAIAKVTKITITGGTWAGGDAAGVLIIEPMTTTGFSAAEVVKAVTIAPKSDSATSYATAVVTADILTTGAEAAGGVTTGDTQIGQTYPAGLTIYGEFTKILLASGALEAYKG